MLNQKISRRDFLTAVAAVSALGLAGCGGTSADAGSASASADGDLLAQISDRGEMVFATEGTWSPWTFHNEAGELTGFDIEVARAIADKHGVRATFAEGEWDGLLAGLDSGRYDTMANGGLGHPRARGEVRLHRAVCLQPHRGHHHRGFRHRLHGRPRGQDDGQHVGIQLRDARRELGATNRAWTTSTRPSSCSRAVASTRP